jgi:membrane fusion protein, copper/silver efflux system
MKTTLFRNVTVGLGMALVAALLLAPGCRGKQAGTEDTAASARTATRYHCPMHPSYTSDKPGTCPICGMNLVPTESPKAGAAGERKIVYYRSPMDPGVRSDKPAKDSMGMDFIPVYEDEAQQKGSGVLGRAVVTIPPERRQLLGVRSEVLRRERLDHEIRTVGRVSADERLLHHIHTKVDGYIEHLYVDFTGKFVQKGEPLVSIYSPDLVATQQEYLLAYRAQAELSQSGIASVSKSGIDLLDAARRRLLLWDIRPEEIATLEREGQVKRDLDLYSDISGYVVQKMALHGMRVTPVDTLFDIADLSSLWVLADVYETDLASIRLGMQAEISVAAAPGRRWRGPITWVSPTVEEKTRTIKVRVEVPNPDGLLKPDMFADVFLRSELGVAVLLPEGAVIDAGDRKLVFLDVGEGRFEPREVQLGAKVGSGFQVLSGVADGERVVTSANFLIDSESSLKAAIAGMSPASPAPAGHQH